MRPENLVGLWSEAVRSEFLGPLLPLNNLGHLGHSFLLGVVFPQAAVAPVLAAAGREPLRPHI
jgi:hypothetical protein